MGKAKKGQKIDESKFEGKGTDFKCKLIGFVNVPSARGDDICQEAITKLKHLALKLNKEKKEHKQKITVNITVKGIRLIDEPTERIEHAHPINRISYICHDNDDKRTFGYIVGTKEGYKLFAIRTMKEAEYITKTLKDLFQVVFERHQAQKAASDTSEIKGQEQVEEKDDEEKFEVGEEQNEEPTESPLLDWEHGINEQIQAMQNDAMSTSGFPDPFGDAQFDSAAADPFGDSFTTNLTIEKKPDDPFNPFGTPANADNATKNSNADLFSDSNDFFSQSTSQSNQGGGPNRNSNELFSLDSSSATSKISANESAEEPLLINDPFAELKKNINELHKQNQYQQQQHYAFQQQGFGNQIGAFSNMPQQGGAPQMMQQPNQYQPQQNNPFAQNMFPAQGGTSYQNNAQPPTLPSRVPPVQPNPFQTQKQPEEQYNGWTVNKPTPAPRAPPRPTQPLDDPFAFLDNQTGKNIPASTTLVSHSSQPTQSNNISSNELLDFLG